MLISVTVKPNNKLVWNESVGITLDMIENVWKDSAEMVVEHATEMTLSVCNTRCSVFKNSKFLCAIAHAPHHWLHG